MTFKEILGINSVGVFTLSILLIFIQTNKSFNKAKSRLFTFASIMNIIIIINEVFDYYLYYLAGTNDVWFLHRITNAISFCCYPFVPYLMCCIYRNKINMKLMIPALLNILLSISSIWTNWIFTVTPNNVYLREPLFFIPIGITFLYITITIVYTMRQIQTSKFKEGLFLYVSVLTMIINTYLQIFQDMYFLVWNFNAAILTLYYMFLNLQTFRYDPLTGVQNRGMFINALEKMPGKDTIYILMFDLNDLKTINDTYGHAEGDKAIISFTRVAYDQFKTYGHIYRIGGDEFVVLLKNIDEWVLKKKIKQMEDQLKAMKRSVAYGYVTCLPGGDINRALKEADEKMYKNKRETKEKLHFR